MTQDNKENPYLPLIDKAARLSAKSTTPSTVAVLGAGTMGLGIASVLASRCGMDVNLYDIDIGQLKAAEEIAGINTTTKLSEAVEGVDLVIEAVPEILSLKKEIIDKCSDVDPFDDMFFKVKDISDKSNFAGMHFFNPVHKMPLVEVVAGEFTSEETIGVLCKTVIAMGKIPLVCNDCSGFVVNRMLMPYLIEFDKLVSEGHDYSHIDSIMKNHGWPMGPAELCDLVGLDVVYHGSQSIAKEYDHITVSDNSVCHRLYKNQDFGRKSYRGFYSYDPSSGKKVGRFFTPGETRESSSVITDRLISPMLNEAKMLLDENIVDSVEEIDAALALGAGLPPFITTVADIT